MILIPDIHINAKYGNKILAKLEELFAKHKDDEVVFLGDYVYMFSYDRSYLLKLFKLFISLCKEGRKVKIMAGNHDWIQDQFVFEEGKHLREMFEAGENTMKGSLQFITQPTQWVDEMQTLHVVIPYNDRLEEPAESEFYDTKLLTFSEQTEVLESSRGLLESPKKGEKLSWLLNSIVLTYYETNKNKYPKIVFYHHYYTAKTFFPGVNTQFQFRDGAIHPKFLDINGIMLISGHIHEPFSFQNYLCCGSFWHTSSLEKNEAKYYFVWDVNKWFEAQMLHINPKISFEVSSKDLDGEIEITDLEVQEQIDKMLAESQNNLKSSFVPIIIEEIISLANLDVTLQTAGPTSQIKAESLAIKLNHIEIKKIDNLVNKDQFNSIIESDFRSSFSDWKQLLSEYLHHKYDADHDSLIDFLHNYNIIWKNTLDTWQ
jgi:predicted phosphodiesterase